MTLSDLERWDVSGRIFLADSYMYTCTVWSTVVKLEDPGGDSSLKQPTLWARTAKGKARIKCGVEHVGKEQALRGQPNPITMEWAPVHPNSLRPPTDARTVWPRTSKNWFGTTCGMGVFQGGYLWPHPNCAVPYHHHHLRLAPLRVCSATGRQQPPEWSVLGQVDCVGPWQPVGVEVILYRPHPGRLPQCTQILEDP